MGFRTWVVAQWLLFLTGMSELWCSNPIISVHFRTNYLYYLFQLRKISLINKTRPLLIDTFKLLETWGYNKSKVQIQTLRGHEWASIKRSVDFSTFRSTDKQIMFLIQFHLHKCSFTIILDWLYWIISRSILIAVTPVNTIPWQNLPRYSTSWCM